jgi:aryl-alcohol dehydrogenase-like predicted oxidoreductase
MSKLALGTVQFGLSYGINNVSGIPSDIEIENIFKAAFQAGINTIDTAQVYGNAESRIGKLTKNQFNVVTKFKQISSDFPFEKGILESLEKLQLKSLYGYMAHDADILLMHPEWWIGLEEVKKSGIVKKIGYSLYTVNQLDALLSKNMLPDIVQIPYNVLDRRFEQYLYTLDNMGVEIHIRSVFLQGLLQMKVHEIPPHLTDISKYLYRIHQVANRYNMLIGQLCLGFALQNKLISKIVIGVDNLSQLMDNINISNSIRLSDSIIDELLSIEVIEKELLDPSKWK